MAKLSGKTDALDELDCKIIRLMQLNGRMSYKAMAKELNVSEYTARMRLKRLIDEKVIEIVAVSAPSKLGYDILGNLKIKIDLQKADHILEKLCEIDAFIWVALYTGGMDIDADFVVSSMAEFDDMIFEKISKIDGIISTETSLMVKLVKDKHDWGTAWDKKAKPHSRINRTAKDR
jgi:Lrp/AsnC family transcriptional regulator for asnA, asnC and gidA